MGFFFKSLPIILMEVKLYLLVSVTASVTKLKVFYLATVLLLLSGQVRRLASFCHS